MFQSCCMLLGVGMLVFSICSGTVNAADTIKMGVVGAHSGDLASYGIPTIKAAELVIAKFNSTGGILGKKIELLVEDDQCKTEIATNTATKLLADKVNVVLGHICSGPCKAAMGIYKSENVIAMSPSATNTELTKSGNYPNFFRTIAPDDARQKHKSILR